jgi:short subunit fatty acids transporter
MTDFLFFPIFDVTSLKECNNIKILRGLTKQTANFWYAACNAESSDAMAQNTKETVPCQKTLFPYYCAHKTALRVLCVCSIIYWLVRQFEQRDMFEANVHREVNTYICMNTKEVITNNGENCTKS